MSLPAASQLAIPRPHRRGFALRTAGGLALLAGCIGVASSVGSTDVSLGEVAGVLGAHLPGGDPSTVPASIDAIVWQVRLPRVLLAALVGIGLSVSGALYQSLLRNPLAEPYLLGVSSGAALAAVTVSSTGLASGWAHALPISAFVGALGASAVIVALARVDGRLPVATLILAGVALGAFLSSITAFVLIRGQGTSETFVLLGWLMGSLARADGAMLALLTPYVLVPLALSLPLVRWANLLLLGDQQARNLGVPVETARLALLALAGVLAAASVAGAGLVGFVGLVVPHAVRLVVGPDNRELLPLAACGGGAFVVLCDALGRWLFAPLEVPVGIVTAMCGAPFFLWLLREKRAVTLE